MSEKSEKSWSTTLILCFFLGSIGAHSFYLQKTGKGIAQLLTLGGFGVWSLIDFLTILFGITKDAEGKIVEKPANVLKVAGGVFAGVVVLVLLLIAYGSVDEVNTNEISDSSNNSKAKISKINCYKIKIGMKYNQVKSILGEPTQTTDSEISGIGKSELWHFQDTGLGAMAAGKIEACDINFFNGKVQTRSWTKL